MKCIVAILAILIVAVNSSFLRSTNKNNSTDSSSGNETDVVTAGDLPPKPKEGLDCDPFSENPCRKHKFITPDITEEKFYNATSGLFLVHKLTSQEAQNVKAKVEPGVEEVDPEVVKAEKKKAAKAGSSASEGKTKTEKNKKNDILKVAKEEEELKANEAKMSGLGKVEEFVRHNEVVLKEHRGHKEKVNERFSKTRNMIANVKQQLEELRAKEDALTKEHRRYDIHTKIANLMKVKRDLDSKIQTHAAKLKVLDAERKQLDTQQQAQVMKLDGLKGNLDSVHLKIINLKKALGLNGEGATGGIADAEAGAEKQVEENAAKAIANAGPKVVAEAKEEEAKAATAGSSTGGATGSSTGGATGSSTGGATGNEEKANKKTSNVQKNNGATGAATGSGAETSTVTEDALASEVDAKIKATEAKLKALEASQ